MRTLTPASVTLQYSAKRLIDSIQIWHPFLSTQVLYTRFRVARDWGGGVNTYICTARKLSEARPTPGAVTESGANLGCVATGTNSFGGCPWTAVSSLSNGQRALSSPHSQGPNKASKSAVTVHDIIRFLQETCGMCRCKIDAVQEIGVIS